ncbi:MAG: transglutaminase-like domain-containing protein [Spirochaetota bacterium]
MSRQTRSHRVGALRALHFASLAILLFHYHRYVSELVSLPFFTVVVVLSAAAAGAAQRARLRTWVACAAAALALWLLRELGLILLSRAQAVGGLAGAGDATPVFDRSFLASVPAAVLTFGLSFAVFRRPRLFAWHPLLLAPVVVALFWSQGGFRVSIFSHPSILAAMIAGFLLVEIALTMLATIRTGFGTGGGPAGAESRSAAAGGAALAATDGSRLGRRELVPLLLILLPLLLGVLFSLLARYSEASTAQGGGLIRPTLFRFDFADYVNLESEISLSRDLVLLYREEAQSPEQEVRLRTGDRLLRRFVLSGYEAGRGFFAESAPGETPEPQSVGDGAESFEERRYERRSELLQEFYLVNFDPSSLVSVNYPVEVAPFEAWADSSFARIYEVTSRASDAGSEALSEAEAGRARATATSTAENGGEDGGEWHRYYTEYGSDEEIADLAEEVTEGVEGDFAKARALEQFFLDEYFYSLRPGVAADGNQLHHFLFESRKGYCSYFAFSMTLMARSLDLPARVAVGFFVDPRMSVMDYYAVRADMAHAWVEIYFEDYGWIEFDPTSTTLAEGEQYSMNPNMDMDEISQLLEELRDHRDELSRADSESPAQASEAGGEPALGGFLRFLARRWAVLLALAYLGAVTLYRYWPRMRAAVAGSARVRAQLRFRSLSRTLGSVGLSKAPSETISEYALRLERSHSIGAEGWVQLYLKALFGEEFSGDDYARFEAAEQSVLRAFRREVSIVRRVLGLLVPFLSREERLR